MTTTRIITGQTAADLLAKTAQNNATGKIGGPFALTGFDLTEALATINRPGVISRSLCIKNGLITLIIRNPKFGDSHLYINPNPAVTDPWSR